MFAGQVETAGEQVEVRCVSGWITGLITRAVGTPLATPRGQATVAVDIEPRTTPFDLRGLRTITRSAFSDGRRTVLHNACGSGFDLRIETSDQLVIAARYRPGPTLHGANLLLRSRFALLVGQTLVHYPALWRAGWRGRVPLHVAVLAHAGAAPMLAGPAGVGKSTVVAAALNDGAVVTADNVCVADERECFGLAEPLRLDAARRASTSHGRAETTLRGRVGRLSPDRIVLLERGSRGQIEPARPAEAATALVGGTYAAGELRRYWQFAATLALATGVGPAHPPIGEVARTYADRLPGLRIQVGDGERVRLDELSRIPA